MEDILKQQKALAELIQKHSVVDGVHETLIPSLYIIQISKLAEPSHRVFKPCFCVIAQGLKEVFLAQERFNYGLTDYLVASMDLPVVGKIIKATPELPYLSIKLEFTHSQILEVINEANLIIKPKDQTNRALFVGQMEPTLMDATLRLVKLLDRPEDIPFLAPLITKEVLYALLKSPYGVTLGQIAMEGSNNYRIMETIEHITRYFDQPLRVEQLAETANMSTPSFHRNFKQVTGMSPIQFQKQLRLQEARRLLLSESAEASEAAFRVGYESPSQFSREYSRLFGAPPKSDIKHIKEIYDSSKSIVFLAD
ncbi:AraC family transcriptional regulator [Paenibacillus urinalis]|uniref:AraC family transcriptional regulator n=1 Tax=Paenibacillus urinalis TaxID=521520 RepID=A0ABY7X342_9BACL|nr:AraC family transcriptional regulator [Paenibacillus urinalis]WDH96618.1 AraC family transcriptional regulator [Paenibacillus urinalis]WDI00262.1 AraC family transcriptional regulator [Paenibacillus urinalis]